MEFNYLLNTSTMGNMEHASEGQREIIELDALMKRNVEKELNSPQ